MCLVKDSADKVKVRVTETVSLQGSYKNSLESNKVLIKMLLNLCVLKQKPKGAT